MSKSKWAICVALTVVLAAVVGMTACSSRSAAAIEWLSVRQKSGEDAHSPGAALPPGPRLVIQTADNNIQYLSLDGSTALLVADAPSSLLPAGYGGVPFGGAPMTDGPMVYLRQWSGGLYVLDTPAGRLISLDFAPTPASPLAVRPLTEGPLPDGSPISLAWSEFSASHTASAHLYLAAPDGSQAIEALGETYGPSDQPAQFVPWRWRQDGQLYFAREPVGGLGGFHPFVGVANLWIYDPRSDSGTELISDQATGGQLCLDAIAPDERWVAHHCDAGRITLLNLETGRTTAVRLPEETPGNALLGSVRFRPDGSRFAFAAMTGGYGQAEKTRGIVGVSDGLSGGSHVVATSKAGEWFSVAAWLPGDVLVLQSHAAGPSGSPAVWIVGTDGSEQVELAKGMFLAKFDA
jgi:hypothetical protein